MKTWFPTAVLQASLVTGILYNVHSCSKCGALVATEGRDLHEKHHEREGQS